jgi:hypothetical protein
MSRPRTPPTPESQNAADLAIAANPARLHEPLFDNTSVSDVLHRIGLSPLAVASFMEVHLSTPPLLAMPSFLRYLRDLVGDSRTTPDATFCTRMRFDALRPLVTWDNDLDSETLVTLAIWYKAHDNRLRTFDWERFLDPDAFETYACTPSAEAAALIAPLRLAEPRNLFGRPAPAVPPPAPPLVLPLVAPPPAPPDSMPPAADTPPPTGVLDLTGYEHNYHAAILASDAADFHRRATNDSVHCTTLGPRMWRNTTLSTNITDMDRKTFLTTNLHVLESTDATLINNWYSQLVLQATSANVDLCPLREFDSSQALWPSNSPASHVTEMANVILVKIAPLINLRCPALHLLYDSEVTHSDSKLAGYRFLHALLALADVTVKQSLFAIPLFSATNDVIQFATDLYQFQQDNARQNRIYTDRQLSYHYLQTLTASDYPLQVQFTQLRDLPLDLPLPPSLHFRTIALALTQQHLHDNNPGSTGLFPGATTASPRRPFQPSAHRLTRQPDSGTSRASRPPPLADGPFRLREETQCLACGTWGHQMSRCSQLAKHTLLTKYLAAHTADAERAAASWKLLHSAGASTPRSNPVSSTTRSPAPSRSHVTHHPISRRLSMPSITVPLFDTDDVAEDVFYHPIDEPADDELSAPPHVFPSSHLVATSPAHPDFRSPG